MERLSAPYYETAMEESADSALRVQRGCSGCGLIMKPHPLTPLGQYTTSVTHSDTVRQNADLDVEFTESLLKITREITEPDVLVPPV